ncbi:hypothetical protein ACE02H_10040 [Shewanella mangrovisoli]|uniref:hypothetical protein n=1 Tax=Shewanella mangrovisoli TaxID=2864211 RepID=UPI0035BB9153
MYSATSELTVNRKRLMLVLSFESDKTALGNATIIRCGRLSCVADSRMMAAEMDISPSVLAKLVPLDYVMKDMNTNHIVKGNLKSIKTTVVDLNYNTLQSIDLLMIASIMFKKTLRR